jgi:hypothetical protein
MKIPTTSSFAAPVPVKFGHSFTRIFKLIPSPASPKFGLRDAEVMKKLLSAPPLPGTFGRDEMLRPNTSPWFPADASKTLGFGLIDVPPLCLPLSK